MVLSSIALIPERRGIALQLMNSAEGISVDICSSRITAAECGNAKNMSMRLMSILVLAPDSGKEEATKTTSAAISTEAIVSAISSHRHHPWLRDKQVCSLPSP